MNIERSRTLLRLLTIVLTTFTVTVVVVFLYLLFTQPQIVPTGETFGSFWIKNFSILIAALAFASSALAATHNSIEQRLLRYMENYPYLEVFSILSVDPLPSPVPRVELLNELSDFNTAYLKVAAPSQQISTSDIEFRYLAVVFRNVGHGYITKIAMSGTAEVPNRGFGPRKFKIERRFNLPPGESFTFTILPFAGLPEFKACITSLEYNGHFVKMKDFDGQKEFREVHPFAIPPERKEIVFLDDFQNIPAGLDWIADFWGGWQPTQNIYVPLPVGDNHHFVFRGDNVAFDQHFNKQSGAYKDLIDYLVYGQTVQITARVRSNPGTTGSIQLWCHDLAANPKNRYSPKITPSDNWQEISMLYTSTQTPHLRVHLLYFPGDGEIQVDKVMVERLHT